ncbi:MAG TPA: FecR domain-containing protein [Polyangiaceae bacterium]|nr:FecR domain-containing protein [Polyangiaceae bacterium]
MTTFRRRMSRAERAGTPEVPIDPAPLMAGNDAVGDVLREGARQQRASAAREEAASWRRLEAHLNGLAGHGLSRPAIARVFATALVCSLLIGGAQWWRSRAGSPPSPPAIAMVAPLELATGTTALEDGSEVVLGHAAKAAVRETRRGGRIDLHHGTVRVRARRQPPGRTLAVVSGGYSFRVVGTEFTVTASEQEPPRLEVVSGQVEVLAGDERRALVGAGGRWPPDAAGADTRPGVPPHVPSEGAQAPAPLQHEVSSQAAADPSTTPQNHSVQSRSTELPARVDCLRAAREGDARGAERCFEAQSRLDGLAAELAMYELGRLRRDALGRPAEALQTFRHYRRRFPGGSFRAEVAVSIAELLLRTGRHVEAVREIDALLSTAAGAERRVELSFLRARSLEALGEWRRAERQYAQLEELGGGAGARARLARARCLEAAGDRARAVAVYRGLLRDGLHEKTASSRLRALLNEADAAD